MHDPKLVRALMFVLALVGALAGAAFLVHLVAAVRAAHGL